MTWPASIPIIQEALNAEKIDIIYQIIIEQTHIIRFYRNFSSCGEKHFDGLMQEGCNSSALAMELRLSCINPLIWCKSPLLYCSYTEARIKWWCFADNIFKCIFMNEKFPDFTDDVWSWGSTWQWVSIGSGNGLVPNRWQVITWINDGQILC